MIVSTDPPAGIDRDRACQHDVFDLGVILMQLTYFKQHHALPSPIKSAAPRGTPLLSVPPVYIGHEFAFGNRRPVAINEEVAGMIASYLQVGKNSCYRT